MSCEAKKCQVMQKNVRWCKKMSGEAKKMSGDAWVEERQYAGITTPGAKGSERRLVTWDIFLYSDIYIFMHIYVDFEEKNVCSRPNIYLLYFFILNLCVSVCMFMSWMKHPGNAVIKQNHVGSKSLKENIQM